MKKILTLFIVLMISFYAIALDAHADVGPKPTADILVIGIEKDFYFDVLIEISGDVETLSSSLVTEMIEFNYYQNDYPSHLLNGYQDEDGFASRTLYDYPASIVRFDTEKNEFHLGYFNAPKVFKIVIILEDDTMIVSDVIHRQLFNSNMTYDLTGVDLSSNQFGVGKVEENIPYNDYTLSLILRVIVTILVELFILWLFKYRNLNSYKITGLTNFITQTLLSLGLVLGYYFWGSFFGLFAVLIIGEFLVFVAEIAVYAMFLKEKGHGRAVLYGFVANLVTLILTIFTLALI